MLTKVGIGLISELLETQDQFSTIPAKLRRSFPTKSAEHFTEVADLGKTADKHDCLDGVSAVLKQADCIIEFQLQNVIVRSFSSFFLESVPKVPVA